MARLDANGPSNTLHLVSKAMLAPEREPPPHLARAVRAHRTHAERTHLPVQQAFPALPVASVLPMCACFHDTTRDVPAVMSTV